MLYLENTRSETQSTAFKENPETFIERQQTTEPTKLGKIPVESKTTLLQRKTLNRKFYSMIFYYFVH